MKTIVQTITEPVSGLEAIQVGSTEISRGGIVTDRMLVQCDTYRLVEPLLTGKPYRVQGMAGGFVVFSMDLPRLTKAEGARLVAEFTRVMRASGYPLTSAARVAA